MTLLASSREIAAHAAEAARAIRSSKAAGYFLLYFWHADGAFANIIGERHSRIADKKQYGIGMLAQAA